VDDPEVSVKKSTPVLMLAAALLVCGGIWWVGREGGETDANAEFPVFTFLDAEVERILWIRPGGEVEVERREERWRLVRPAPMAADTEELDARLRQAFENSARVEKDAVPPDVHGLDAPLLKVALTARGGRKAVVSFGKSLGAGRRMYARIEGRPELLTVDEVGLYHALNASLAEVREPRLVQVDMNDALSTTVEHEGKTTTVRREGAWFVIEGEVQDLAGLRELVIWERAMTAIRTEKWEPHDPKIAYGFEAPFARIVFHLKDRDVTLTVGAPTEAGGARRWARSSDFPGEAATVGEAEVARAMPRAEDLRAPLALPLDFSGVTRYGAACGALDVEVARDAGKWKPVRPVVQPDFDTQRVDTLIGMLATLPATDRVPPVDPPADAVLVTLATSSPAGAASHQARFWRHGADVFVRTENPARQLRLAGSTVDAYLRAGEGAFRDAHLVKLGVLLMSGIRFEPADTPPYEVNFDGQKFSLQTTIPGKTLDKDKAAALYGALSGLVVETWVREGAEDPATGLARPWMRITLTPDPAKVTAPVEVLLVGSEGSAGTRYGKLEGKSGVFLLPSPVVALIAGGPWK
jgi:hypothetical protein